MSLFFLKTCRYSIPAPDFCHCLPFRNLPYLMERKHSAMIKDTPVSKFMSKELILLDERDSIWEAEKTFRDFHLRHAPVVLDGVLTGMLSLTDFNRYTPEPASSKKAGGWNSNPSATFTIGQIMTNDPMTVQMNTSLEEVASIFTENEFHAMPVLEGDNIVGIVSTTDVISFLMDAIE